VRGGAEGGEGRSVEEEGMRKRRGSEGVCGKEVEHILFEEYWCVRTAFTAVFHAGTQIRELEISSWSEPHT